MCTYIHTYIHTKAHTYMRGGLRCVKRLLLCHFFFGIPQGVRVTDACDAFPLMPWVPEKTRFRGLPS